jgi:hypothetical protein
LFFSGARHRGGEFINVSSRAPLKNKKIKWVSLLQAGNYDVVETIFPLQNPLM